MTISQSHRGFVFGSYRGLHASEMEELIQGFLAPVQKTEGVLRGRMQARQLELQGTGSVVIKPYFRGGLLRHVNKRTYLGIGKPRSMAEFEMLEHVRSLGVYAPEPVAYAVKGRIFYHAWLITAQIQDAVSLSELSLNNSAAAKKAVSSVARQVGILVSGGIYHVDLHPGNVLVNERGTAWFIDFDRAKTGVQNRQKLFKRYVKRWKRAADKYGLPGFVREALRQIEF
ncbi:MAG: lipopolysaccharide kinase InaA family protein [Desulfobacterales bacterium]